MKQMLRLAVAGLVVAQAPLIIPGRSLASDSQTFQCITITENTHYATVFISQDTQNKTAPARVIDWQTSEFIPKGYTQKVRCNTVTAKLNKAVSANGGKLSNLWLTVGKFGPYLALCYVNDMHSGCNEQNILFTFNREHRRDPNEALARLLDISVMEQGNPVQESHGQPYINLKDLVKKGLTSGDYNKTRPFWKP